MEHIRRGSAAEALNSTGLAAGATAGKVDSGGGARCANKSELIAEESQIRVLEAAINLSPTEICKVDQIVLSIDQLREGVSEIFGGGPMANRNDLGADPASSNGTRGVVRGLLDLLAVRQCKLACWHRGVRPARSEALPAGSPRLNGRENPSIRKTW